jgi:hypothetical protein
MPLGDGITWDETQPTQQTAANILDAVSRDIRVGVSARMRMEHVWPISQTNTSQAGYHTYLTFPLYTAFPGLVGSGQLAGIWVNTSQSLMYSINGIDFSIMNSDGLPNIISGTNINISTSGTISVSTTAVNVLNYGSSTNTGVPQDSNTLKIAHGVATPAGNSTWVVTGLPFANATSYRVSIGNYSLFPMLCTRNSGTQITFFNPHNDNVSGNGNGEWIAIGN